MNETGRVLSSDTYTIVEEAYADSVLIPAAATLPEPVRILSRVIAGKRIGIRFYSTVLAEKMTAAFAHHPAYAGTPELVIHAWDGETAMLPSPWRDPAHHARETSAQRPASVVVTGAYLYGEETLNLFDARTGEAYFWLRDANALPDWVSAAPFRTILHWFLSRSGIHLVHGACVGIGGKAVLLGAKGGSGKSTTSLASLFAGLDYLGDDYVAVTSGAHPKAYSLYASAKITPDALESFPELKDRIWNAASFGGKEDKGKAVVFLANLFPAQLAEHAELAAILIPSIKHETRIVPASKAATMLALAPTILFQLPLAAADKLTELKGIIGSVPCYTLELGPDKRRVPDAIRAFLGRIQ